MYMGNKRVYIFLRVVWNMDEAKYRIILEETWNTDKWLFGWKDRWMKKVWMNGQTGWLINDRSTDGRMMDRLVDDQKTGGQMDGRTESLGT